MNARLNDHQYITHLSHLDYLPNSYKTYHPTCIHSWRLSNFYTIGTPGHYQAMLKGLKLVVCTLASGRCSKQRKMIEKHSNLTEKVSRWQARIIPCPCSC